MSFAGLPAFLTLALAGGPAPGAAADRPGVITLLANEDAYRAVKSPEMIYLGTLERNPGSGKIGAGHFNAYRLTGQDGAGKPVVHELHVPSKAHLLAAQVGQRVRVIGKLVPADAGGKAVPELWPARVEALDARAAVTPGEDGILARCSWQPEAARQRGARQYIFRDGRPLAQELKLSGASAEETATALLAQKLGVAAIDWKKQMLLTLAAGLRGAEVEKLVVTRVRVQDNSMTVTYRLQPGAGGFGYPAETVLVERFDGPVRYVEEPAAKKAP
jgi:hypothetical protein